MSRIYKQCSVLGLGLALGLAPHLGLAQSPIGGTVTDDHKQPLPGVSVVIKGTSKGTTTDSDGRFVLPTKPGDVLVISSLGAVAQEVTVGTQTTLAVTLATDNKQLDEVVVTALGVKRKPAKSATRCRRSTVRTLCGPATPTPSPASRARWRA